MTRRSLCLHAAYSFRLSTLFSWLNPLTTTSSSVPARPATARLTEDANVRVLLLEAGLPDYRLDFRTQMPAALAMPLQGTTYNWGYKTDPEPHMDNRRMDCGRGKGLGGSSLINGMCYIRGNALDFDHWAKKDGLADWRYHDVLPYFRKAECRDIGPNAYHGGHGPIEVTTAKPATNPLFEAMIEAGVQAGYPRTDDLNGYQQEGFGPMDRFVTRQGPRLPGHGP